MEIKNYSPTVEGYKQLTEDNLYLLEICRTVTMNYIFPRSKSKDLTTTKNKFEDLDDLLKFCGIKIKSKKIKDQTFYMETFNKFVKEIDQIEYTVELGIMDEVVKVANICLKTRAEVVTYRANKKKKGIFKLILG